MESCHRNLLLLTEAFLAQVSAVAFTQQQDDFFRLVSLLFIHFLGFGFHQILSLNMDHFLWRRPVGGNAFSDYFGRVFGYPAAMGFEGLEELVKVLAIAAFLLVVVIFIALKR